MFLFRYPILLHYYYALARVGGVHALFCGSVFDGPEIGRWVVCNDVDLSLHI